MLMLVEIIYAIISVLELKHRACPETKGEKRQLCRGTDQLKRCWFVRSRKASAAWDTTRLPPSSGVRRSRAHVCQLPPDLPPEAWKTVLLYLLQGRRWTPGRVGGCCAPPRRSFSWGSAWLPTVLPRREAGPSSRQPPLPKPSPGVVFCSFFQPPPQSGGSSQARCSHVAPAAFPPSSLPTQAPQCPLPQKTAPVGPPSSLTPSSS